LEFAGTLSFQPYQSSGHPSAYFANLKMATGFSSYYRLPNGRDVKRRGVSDWAAGAPFAAMLHRADFPQIASTVKKIKAGCYCLRRCVQTFRYVLVRKRFSFRQQSQ
jgi:hypothetical protein